MPHRADYFVLAYSWDHHCRRLYNLFDERLGEIEREVACLEQRGTRAVRDYRRRWQAALEDCRNVLAAIEKRQFTINSLGYRGYGVNRDLLAALGTLGEKGGRLKKRLEAQPRGNAPVPGREESKPAVAGASGPDLGHYWRVMAQETPMETNTAIFTRMFLSGGYASMTIMKGTAGLHSGHSYHELKQRANRDFRRAVREIFARLPEYAEINIGMLKQLHYDLTASLDINAGSFREIDFPDRNGVTFEFDNFYREVSDLAIVLDETARSFHHFEGFIYNLARAYYMFIGIHPFWDANGRVGRCFLNSLFLKKGLPPVRLDSDDEVLALPRYGGSMEEMHDYLKKRLHRATITYLHERSKLEAFGLMGKRIYNASFDSGFHFRQIDDHGCGHGRQIEMHFEALVIDDNNDLNPAFREESRVVLPDARLLSTLIVYCGLCDAPFSQWRHPFKLNGGFYVEEMPSEMEGVMVFDVDILFDMPRQARPGDLLACSVVSEEMGLIFNNKGLNYSYRLDG
jgi:fido (protein-threonine AMPylation protein)